MPDMIRRLENIFWLGLKELQSLRRDPVLMLLILYTFTVGIYTVANGVRTEVRNASIAMVDEDGSELSRRIRDAFIPPYFRPAALISIDRIDPAMNAGRYSFVIQVPSGFQADVLAGRQPILQVYVDATAMTLAGNGVTYVSSIVNNELLTFVDRAEGTPSLPVNLTVRARFNPNMDSSWFTSVMQIINSITILAIILSGAAVIREREHGTMEHLLVMPLAPVEIMFAKIWANALVIVCAAVLSLYAVVQGVLAVPIHGSIALFAAGTAIYLFSVTALGILLSTLARSMPQFGLLSIPVFVVMIQLSGSITPLESMPRTLQTIMQAAPSTHFIRFAQAVLYRGAGIDIVWPQLVAVAGIGAILLAAALMRFRETMTLAR
jgi:ABC-2 type transport system permease protein